MVGLTKRPTKVEEAVRLLRQYGLPEEVARDVTLAAEKANQAGGITLNAAASKYDVPQTFLWRWADDGKIAIIQRATRAGSRTIVKEADAKRAADIYHEAKRQGMQPNRLWKMMQN